MSSKINKIAPWLGGIVLGFCLCFIYKIDTTEYMPSLPRIETRVQSNQPVLDPLSHEEIGNATEFHSPDEEALAGEAVEAQRLCREVRVLCWVMTAPDNHKKKAIHVKNTWGARCNKLIFMSSKTDKKLGSIRLPNVQEGRDWLWAKTKEAFKYVWEKHRDEADWFMKADDDTFVVMENLRFMLRDYDPNYPIYFGCRFKLPDDQGYMSGGAGYVLSREALKRFVEQALPNKDKCKETHDGEEDVEMGKCLESVGVEAGDSRDSLGRHRFMPFVPEYYIIPGNMPEDFWYWNITYYPTSLGKDALSDTAISFHYIEPPQMYVFEYLIYNLRAYGISHDRLTISNKAKGKAVVRTSTVPTLALRTESSVDTMVCYKGSNDTNNTTESNKWETQD